MSIRDIPITAKLMLLRAGAQNFKSVGKEMIVDLTESNSLLCIAKENGAGKSTLRKECVFYAMTGKTSHKGESVDSLVNSEVFKNMKVFLEFHFSGQYYRIDRGRKPKLFSISKLSEDDEWVPIENLPASDKERQGVAYSLMGMDKSYAETLINATILLGGDSFTSFLNLSTPERRLVLEPILDICIFSSLLKDLKNERGGIITSQTEVLAQVNDIRTKVALAEQALEYSKTQKYTTESQYKASTERLSEELAHCITELKTVSEITTDGSELKEVCFKTITDLMKDRTELEVKLNSDIDSLGEFEIDKNDDVLVDLSKQLANISDEIGFQEGVVSKRKLELGDEVDSIITKANNEIKLIEERYLVDKEVMSSTEHIDGAKATLDIIEDRLKANKVHLGDLESADIDIKVKLVAKESEVCAAKKLTSKYQVNIDKLLEVARSFEVKIEVEKDNLNKLVHAGECTSCSQPVSEEWVESLKLSLTDKIEGLYSEHQIYIDRAEKGKVKVGELGLSVLEVDLAELHKKSLSSSNSINELKYVISGQEGEVNVCYSEIEKLSQARSNNLASLESRKEKEVANQKSIIDRAEDKATQELGEDLANLKALKSSAPKRIANLEQQRLDRITALEGEHGGRKSHLINIYKLTSENIESQVLTLKSQLEKDLQALVDHKEREVKRCEAIVKAKEGEIERTTEEFESNIAKVVSDLDSSKKEYKTRKVQLEKLELKHDDLQVDLESCEQAILLCSNSETKADIVSQYIPELNRNVNRYLQDLNFLIEVKFDDEFNLTLEGDERRGQSLHSLSAGQKGKLDISIRLALRCLATSKQSVECNYLLMDEITESFSEVATVEVCDMLKREFSNLNLCIISQKNTMMRELFDNVVCYELRGGFTTISTELD